MIIKPCRVFFGGVCSLIVAWLVVSVSWEPTSEVLVTPDRREAKFHNDQPRDAREVQLCMFSDRLDASYATIKSVCNNTVIPSALRFIVVVSKKGSLIHMIPELQQACPESIIDVYTMEELTQRILDLGMQPVWQWQFKDPRRESNAYPWAVHLASWDYSPKHVSPFNHIRFYIPLIEPFKRLNRILFLDDDVIIQRDVRIAWELQLPQGKVVAASCQNWLWWKECGEFKSFMNATYLEAPYLGWGEIDDTRSLDDAVCKRKDQEQCMPQNLLEFIANWSRTTLGERYEVNLTSLANNVAWNFGFNVFDLEGWRQNNITERYHKWMEFNQQHAIFAPTSLAFGLGIPFLAMMGTIECMDKQLPVIQGLGFVSQNVLSRNGFDASNLPLQFGLHFNGDDKPWDPKNKLAEHTHLYLPYASPKIQHLFNVANEKRVRHDASVSSFLVLTEASAGSDLFMNVLADHPNVCSSGGWSRESFSPLYLQGGWKSSSTVSVCKGSRSCSWSKLSEYVAVVLKEGWCIGTPSEMSVAATEYLGSDYVPLCRLLKSVLPRDEILTAKNGSYSILGSCLPKVWSAFFKWVMREQLLHSAHETETGHAMQELMECKCSASASIVGMKVMIDWLGTRPELLGNHTPAYPYGLNLEAHNPTIGPGAFYYPIFSEAEALGTKLIFLTRKNLVRAYASQERRKQVPECRSRTTNDAQVCRSTRIRVDPKQLKDYLRWRMHLRAVGSTLVRTHNASVLHVSYEDCGADQPSCFNKIADYLGVRRVENLHVKSWLFDNTSEQPLEDIIENVQQAKDALKRANLLHLWTT